MDRYPSAGAIPAEGCGYLFTILLTSLIAATVAPTPATKAVVNAAISQLSSKPCPFCEIPADREIIAENKTALAFYDGFTVTPGHTLIIPKRHVAGYFDLNQDELCNINELQFTCRNILQVQYKPQGFNLGVNVGEAAGQTIFHCHIHLIPRYTGDVANPRGGVRGVIPGRQNY